MRVLRGSNAAHSKDSRRSCARRTTIMLVWPFVLAGSLAVAAYGVSSRATSGRDDAPTAQAIVRASFNSDGRAS